MRRLAVVAAVVLWLLAGACGSGSAGPRVALDEEVEFSLARACLAAGGEQVLHVRAPHPAVALFQAVYADGREGEAGYGGQGTEILPESGTVEMRWRVAAEAPAGEVTVEVGILRGGEPEMESLSFTLVGPDESCP